MTPEQRSQLIALAKLEVPKDKHRRNARVLGPQLQAVADVVLELADRMSAVEAHQTLDLALEGDCGPDPIGKQAEPLQTGAFGCVGSVCRLGQLNRLGCTVEGGCHLEILAERGIIAPPDLPAMSDSRSRARVRDELAKAIFATIGNTINTNILVDRVLSVLRDRINEEPFLEGYVQALVVGVLDDVKAGRL